MGEGDTGIYYDGEIFRDFSEDLLIFNDSSKFYGFIAWLFLQSEFSSTAFWTLIQIYFELECVQWIKSLNTFFNCFHSAFESKI